MYSLRRYFKTIFWPSRTYSYLGNYGNCQNLQNISSSVCVKLSAYDYPVLESCQKLLSDVAIYMNIDVSESCALPAQKVKFRKLKGSSFRVDPECILVNYKRFLETTFPDQPTYALYLRIVEETLPRGAKLEVTKISADFEELRYVPDRQLLDLKSQLDNIQSSRDGKKAKTNF